MASRTLAATVALIVLLAGCGGTSKPARVGPKHDAPKPAQLAPPCHISPQSGQMGACAPKPPPGARLAAPRTVVGSPHFLDLSNNDPIYSVGAYRQMRAHGYTGAVFKLNQAGYIDRTAAGQVAAARQAGDRVGGYDFADTTQGVGPIAEAHIFIGRLQALGLCGGRGVIPPTGDFEYGTITPSYVVTWVAIVRQACGRVQIYTGQWYWNPHVGCFWPRGVPGWISGYGALYLPCGIGADFLEQQFSDHGYNGFNSTDVSVYLHGSASWDRYTNAGPPPKPKPAPLTPAQKRRLAHLLGARQHLRGQIAVSDRQARREIAHLHSLKAEGDHVNRLIRTLRR